MFLATWSFSAQPENVLIINIDNNSLIDRVNRSIYVEVNACANVQCAHYQITSTNIIIIIIIIFLSSVRQFSVAHFFSIASVFSYDTVTGSKRNVNLKNMSQSSALAARLSSYVTQLWKRQFKSDSSIVWRLIIQTLCLPFSLEASNNVVIAVSISIEQYRLIMHDGVQDTVHVKLASTCTHGSKVSWAVVQTFRHGLTDCLRLGWITEVNRKAIVTERERERVKTTISFDVAASKCK